MKRPWLCPEPRCTPVMNLYDSDLDITQPAPGETFMCWGVMERPVTFVYDGVEHPNNCNGCAYTPLKGLLRFQEKPSDWEALANRYSRAAKAAREKLGEKA